MSHFALYIMRSLCHAPNTSSVPRQHFIIVELHLTQDNQNIVSNRLFSLHLHAQTVNFYIIDTIKETEHCALVNNLHEI